MFCTFYEHSFLNIASQKGYHIATPVGPLLLPWLIGKYEHCAQNTNKARAKTNLENEMPYRGFWWFGSGGAG